MLIILLCCGIFSTFIIFPGVALIFQMGFAMILILTILKLYSVLSTRKGLRKETHGIFEQILALLVLAVSAWVLDQAFCTQVQKFQFHAWWHILTAIALFELFQLMFLLREPKSEIKKFCYFFYYIADVNP